MILTIKNKKMRFLKFKKINKSFVYKFNLI